MKSLIHHFLFVYLQLQDEVHFLTKKGHANEKGGFNFVGGLRKKIAKLETEIENFEEHEKMIDKNLKDIKAGGTRLFDKMKFHALQSWN